MRAVSCKDGLFPAIFKAMDPLGTGTISKEAFRNVSYSLRHFGNGAKRSQAANTD